MHGHRTAIDTQIFELVSPPVLKTAHSGDVPRIIYTKSISNLRYRDQSLKTGEILIFEYYAGFLSAGYGELISPLGWLRYHQARASGHPEMSRSTWNRHSKTLQEKGYIYRQVNKTGKHRGCSTIKFTQKFIDIVKKADIKNQNESNVIPIHTHTHTNTQGPKWSPSSTDQRSLPERINNKSESRAPARELDKKSNQEKTSRQSRVPERPMGYPRELNSPMWWLSTCKLVSSEAEKILLQAKLIEHQNHEDISYWLVNWKQRSEYDRSFSIRNIIKTLRTMTIRPVVSPSSSSLPPSSSSLPPSSSSLPPSSSESIATKLLSAMVFGKPYEGPGKEMIEKYKALDDSLKPLMLQDIRTGKVKISNLEQPAASHPE